MSLVIRRWLTKQGRAEARVIQRAIEIDAEADRVYQEAAWIMHNAVSVHKLTQVFNRMEQR